MTTWRADLQLAFRLLSKKPGFTAVAVLTLALGIAVNATMFSLVSAFLLRRPPVRDPDHVVVVSSVNPNPVFQPDAFPISAPNYLAWREANHVFAETAAADPYRSVNLTTQSQNGSDGSPKAAEGGEPEVLRSAAVSPHYFSVLGASARLGRIFVDGEDQPGRDHVVILSHDLWERRFGSDRGIVGRTVRLNREDYTVVGVMPSNFRLMGFVEQLWTPLVLSPADQTATARNNRSLRFFGRLKQGVSLEQARAEMVLLARRAAESFPDSEKAWGASVRTLPDFLIYDFSIRNGLAVMMTAVGFVLMIACANVAGLLLARASGRKKELAIRISLGASRLRIVRQLLTEGLVVAIFGGGFGLLLSYWGIHFFRAKLTFNEAVIAVPVSLDRNVLLFALTVSLVSAVLSGFAPALTASRTDVNANLKDESRAASAGRSRGRLRTVLVTGEIAAALFLLIGTGLLIRGIYMTEHQNLGFRPDHLLTAALTLDDAHYKDAAERALFVRDVLPRLRQIPGAEAVAATSDLPAAGAGRVNFRIKGEPEPQANQLLNVFDVVVTTEFFHTAGIPLLRGRTFAETDNATAPGVLVVNQEFVHRHLHDQDALGKQIRLDLPGAEPQWNEIIGVVANVKSYSEVNRDDPELYEAFLQRPVASFSLMLRTSADSNSLASALRNAVRQLDAELPLAQVMSMPAVIDRQKGGDEIFLQVLGAFAFLALVLASIGIYGLIAYSVGQRTHEIGIRMALGANSPDVLRMILWEGAKMTLVGAAIGFAMALPLPKAFDAMFYDIRLGEPRLYLIVPVCIFAVALLATYVPARRATRVDPMTALRQE
jgi:putative ABC transport system permease protein